MLFLFKQKPEDFLVEEQLGFDFDQQKEFLYILFEKRDQNTMDIVHFLMDRLQITRQNIGIS
ncbi:MAG: tRNA pseudouridine(13) synthase TruD [bacterium]|nr:tRNA pseudouridine(13) synthase TruD [bacterium]